ncbi:MAG: hypothetical protein PHF70_08690, partial [Opitutales bacterium]|nr:hypothetical protein [Opitutales bacterium]
ETPVVEEAESTPQTELSDTNDELTDSETASDTEPESAEPEAVNIEPIEPVAEEIPEAQDTPDESAPQPETTPEPEQADGIIAPSPEPEETLETESVADVAPAEETEPEAVGSEPEAIPEPEAKPTAGIALEPVEEQPESTPVPEPETDTTNPTEDPLSETGFISHDQGNQTQDLPATTEAAVEAAEITGTDISTTEAVTPSNDAPDASPQESLPSLGSIEQPLHSISRIAKLMAVEQPDAQRIKEYAEAIEERSNRMAEQIEELKSMLKQARTQGAASSKQGPIDISRLAEILVNEASSLVSSSDKRVQCNLLDADSLYGLGNESGLTQVINSLIDLGLHCIDSGCVHIDVRSDANEPLESISESYDLNGKTLVPDSKREVIIQTRFQTSPSIRKYLESAFGPNPDFDAIEDDPAIAILAGIASRIRLSVRAMNGRFIFETPVADEVMVQTQWDMQCLREEI